MQVINSPIILKFSRPVGKLSQADLVIFFLIYWEKTILQIIINYINKFTDLDFQILLIDSTKIQKVPTTLFMIICKITDQKS